MKYFLHYFSIVYAVYIASLSAVISKESYNTSSYDSFGKRQDIDSGPSRSTSESSPTRSGPSRVDGGSLEQALPSLRAQQTNEAKRNLGEVESKVKQIQQEIIDLYDTTWSNLKNLDNELKEIERISNKAYVKILSKWPVYSTDARIEMKFETTFKECKLKSQSIEQGDDAFDDNSYVMPKALDSPRSDSRSNNLLRNICGKLPLAKRISCLGENTEPETVPQVENNRMKKPSSSKMKTGAKELVKRKKKGLEEVNRELEEAYVLYKRSRIHRSVELLKSSDIACANYVARAANLDFDNLQLDSKTLGLLARRTRQLKEKLENETKRQIKLECKQLREDSIEKSQEILNVMHFTENYYLDALQNKKKAMLEAVCAFTSDFLLKPRTWESEEQKKKEAKEYAEVVLEKILSVNTKFDEYKHKSELKFHPSRIILPPRDGPERYAEPYVRSPELEEYFLEKAKKKLYPFVYDLQASSKSKLEKALRNTEKKNRNSSSSSDDSSSQIEDEDLEVDLRHHDTSSSDTGFSRKRSPRLTAAKDFRLSSLFGSRRR